MLNINMSPSENNVEIIGTLNELDVTTRTTKDGREYATANLSIRVEQEINGKFVESIIPIRMFAMKEKKDGSLNSCYTTIIQLKENYISLAACPEDETDRASRVWIRNGSFTENMFVGKNGSIVSTPQIRTSYISSATPDAEDKAIFECTGVSLKKIPETDFNEEETGRLIVKLGIIQWGGKIDLIDMIAETPTAVTFINENWDERDTVKVTGQIKMSQETKTWYEPQGFGPDLERTQTKSCREIIITGGSPGCLDESNCYDSDGISAVLNDRKIRIEEIKNKSASITKPKVQEYNF